MKVENRQAAKDYIIERCVYALALPLESRGAGYPIYEGHNCTISDLNTRFEINWKNGKSENIWIKSEDDYKEEILAQLVNLGKQMYPTTI